ncbi:MAG: Rho termination factor N-terminal domain-containing protein, partial [Anaerolineales bacterium]|nr:Rho termination factor N-terminal domain-containing protein [Anaerolineales bacterium]
MDIAKLEKKKLEGLRELAREMDVPGHSRLKKDELILGLLRANAEKKGLKLRGGVLELVDDGIGFLRSGHLLPGRDDVYVSQSQIRRFGMRTGDMVIGQVRAPKDSEKYYGMIRVEAVNGLDPEEAKQRPVFESLTPIFPDERFDLETDRHALATRLINL